MDSLLSFSILIITANLVQPHPDIYKQNPNNENEEGVLYDAIFKYQRTSSKFYSHPTELYPVYLAIAQDEPNSQRQRHILKVDIGMSNRQKRERKFTRFDYPPISLNITPKFQLPIIPTSKPTVYNITISPKPTSKPLASSEPLILVWNPTKTNVGIGNPLMIGNISLGKNVTRTAITALSKMSVNSTLNTTITSKTAESAKNSSTKSSTVEKLNPIMIRKPAIKPHPDPILPPTGDTSDEEYEDPAEDNEEEDDQDDDSQQNENEESSEEEDDKHVYDEESQPVPIRSSILKLNASSSNSKIPSEKVKRPVFTKGDTGGSEFQDDKSEKMHKKKAKKSEKKKKKKSKKGKKKGYYKKAELHFAPAPLGPKADLIFRLDKVHKNVREIFSVVKGVLSDYVIKRPHLNIEFYNKGQIPFESPHTKHAPPMDKHHFDHYKPDSPPPWNPPEWRKQYPNKNNNPNKFSKRFLEECADDDDEKCDEGITEVQESSGNVKPRPLQRFQLPYPIYLESSDNQGDYSPFDSLPPLSSSYFSPGEKTWVKTWDKKKTGLPKIADSAEASKRVKNKQSRQ